MSIIDEALQKLGSGSVAGEVSPHRAQSTAGAMPDIGYVAGRRKRRPISMLMAIALVGAGVVVYLLLPKEVPQPDRKVQIEVPASAPLPTPAQDAATALQAKPAGAKTPFEATPLVADASPPAWYESGWVAARAGKWSDALALWEGGVRSLPSDRMMIVSNSYDSMERFTFALGQHAGMFPSIGARQHLGRQTLYRVIIFPYGGGTRRILPKVQELFPRAGLVNASRIQGGLADGAAQAAPAQEPARLDVQAATQTPPPEQKPPAGKLDAIDRGAEAVAAPNAGDWESRASLVREQLRAEDYPAVGKNAQALTHDFSERWEAWFWLGTAQLAQGQMEAAETALERASKLNPGVAQVWVQRAVVAQERGDHAAAVKLLNEARELSPKSPQIYLNLGYSNDALGLTAEAEKNYIRFLSLTEGDSSYAMQRKPIMQRLESKH